MPEHPAHVPEERSRNRKAANGAPEGERADRKARVLSSQGRTLLPSAFRRSIPLALHEGDDREACLAQECGSLSDNCLLYTSDAADE